MLIVFPDERFSMSYRFENLIRFILTAAFFAAVATNAINIVYKLGSAQTWKPSFAIATPAQVY